MNGPVAENRISLAKRPIRRMSPDERRTEILITTKRLLDEVGVVGFSVEAVAREAGVTAPLLRHYFGSSTALLANVTRDVIEDVERALRSKKTNAATADRISAYMDVIQRHPWGHSIWMRSVDFHPTIDELIKQTRTRLAEGIFRRVWVSLTEEEKLQAIGSAGFFESLISQWIERKFRDRELIHNALVSWVQRCQKSVANTHATASAELDNKGNTHWL